jgi:hypothetical protein
MICKFQENKEVVTRRKNLAVIDRNRQGAKDSYPIKNGENGSRAHPATYSVSTRGLSLELKRPGREVDLLPQSIAVWLMA